MSVQDDINNYIAKYKQNPYNTVGGSNQVKAYDSQYNNDLLSGLGTMSNNYNTSNNALDTQLGAAKIEGQDTMNQNAVDQQSNLKNIMEQMANYGNLGSGQMPILQQQANNSRMNADNKIIAQRNTDINGINTAKNTLDSTTSNGLMQLIADNANKWNNSVQTQQGNEAAAAYKAQQDQIAAADRQAATQQAAYEAEQNRVNSYGIAQINKTPAAISSNTVLKDANSLYTVTSTDPVTGVTSKTVPNPLALLSYISNSGLSAEKQANMIQNYPAYVNGGGSLADWWSSYNSPQTRTQSLQQAVGRGSVQ